MKKNAILYLISSLIIFSILGSCTHENSTEPTNNESINNPYPEPIDKQNTEVDTETFTMSDPAFMMGTSLGILFKTYYKVGDFSKMLTYTSRSTIEKYGAEKLRYMYRSLDLGYDMKLTNMTTEGKEKILHYEIAINATKKVKRLHVVIENDTARIVPQHLERGEIFE